MRGQAWRKKTVSSYSNLSIKGKNQGTRTYVVPAWVYRWQENAWKRMAARSSWWIPVEVPVFACRFRNMKLKGWVAVAALCGAVGACAYQPERESAAPRASPPPPAPPPVVTTERAIAGKLVRYMALQRQALEVNDQQWQALYRRAKADQSVASIERRMERALVLGAPRSTEADQKEAVRLMDELLKESDGLANPVKNLLSVSKHEIVTRSQLKDRIKQLETEQTKLKADVSRLGKALADANEKIQALTTIEKSIERPKNSEVP